MKSIFNLRVPITLQNINILIICRSSICDTFMHFFINLLINVTTNNNYIIITGDLMITLVFSRNG